MSARRLALTAAAVLLTAGTAGCTTTGDGTPGPSGKGRGAAGPVPSSGAPAPPSAATGAPRGPLDPAARRYLDAVANRDADAVAAAFAPDGLVVDVGREIRGRDAIRNWAAAEVVGGAYTLLDHTPHPGGTTLLVRFRPGGAGDGFRARYRFDITDGLITRATLEYA
ncbi:nuclear transport factor 2 family protein [Streptomyces tritici]|uniref:nuclear transport factor 2 family protein n=1 Tax=Streptomyces tritici TaxID=2054410 RepID=UPI003AF1A42A